MRTPRGLFARKILSYVFIIYLIGCNSDVLSDNKEYNQENSYTNIYVGNPEDLIDGPCCQDVDFGPDPDPDFIIDTARESNDFTFRGWADCTGQCEKDIKACVMHHWTTYKRTSEIEICKTYSCGAFGIAYIFSDDGGTYGRDYKVGYPGAISHYNPNTRQTYSDSRASKRICLTGEYDYFGEKKCFDSNDRSSPSHVFVNKSNYQYPSSYLFKDVFYCTNEITYVLDTSLNSYDGLYDYNPDLDRYYPERYMDECLDSRDNDQDGLIDCEDPSCHNALHNECN